METQNTSTNQKQFYYLNFDFIFSESKKTQSKITPISLSAPQFNKTKLNYLIEKLKALYPNLPIYLTFGETTEASKIRYDELLFSYPKSTLTPFYADGLPSGTSQKQNEQNSSGFNPNDFFIISNALKVKNTFERFNLPFKIVEFPELESIDHPEGGVLIVYESDNQWEADAIQAQRKLQNITVISGHPGSQLIVNPLFLQHLLNDTDQTLQFPQTTLVDVSNSLKNIKKLTDKLPDNSLGFTVTSQNSQEEVYSVNSKNNIRNLLKQLMKTQNGNSQYLVQTQNQSKNARSLCLIEFDKKTQQTKTSILEIDENYISEISEIQAKIDLLFQNVFRKLNEHPIESHLNQLIEKQALKFEKNNLIKLFLESGNYFLSLNADLLDHSIFSPSITKNLQKKYEESETHQTHLALKYFEIICNWKKNLESSPENNNLYKDYFINEKVNIDNLETSLIDPNLKLELSTIINICHLRGIINDPCEDGPLFFLDEIIKKISSMKCMENELGFNSLQKIIKQADYLHIYQSKRYNFLLGTIEKNNSNDLENEKKILNSENFLEIQDHDNPIKQLGNVLWIWQELMCSPDVSKQSDMVLKLYLKICHLYLLLNVTDNRLIYIKNLFDLIEQIMTKKNCSIELWQFFAILKSSLIRSEINYRIINKDIDFDFVFNIVKNKITPLLNMSKTYFNDAVKFKTKFTVHCYQLLEIMNQATNHVAIDDVQVLENLLILEQDEQEYNFNDWLIFNPSIKQHNTVNSLDIIVQTLFLPETQKSKSFFNLIVNAFYISKYIESPDIRNDYLIKIYLLLSNFYRKKKLFSTEKKFKEIAEILIRKKSINHTKNHASNL